MFQQLKVPSSKRFRSRGVSYYKICKPLQSYNSKSFGSFFVAGSDLCLSVAKFQVTRVSEVFWLQIPISACLLQSYKLPEFQKFFGCRYRSLPVCFKVPKLPEFQKFFSFVFCTCFIEYNALSLPFPTISCHILI